MELKLEDYHLLGLPVHRGIPAVFLVKTLPRGEGRGALLAKNTWWDVPPSSPNPDPISKQNMLFSTQLLDQAYNP